MKVYLASPLGFSPANHAYLERIKSRLADQGVEVFDPWSQKQFDAPLAKAAQEPLFEARIAAYATLASEIGACNEDGIRWADAILAVLDGAEVDSGTASEVGFASALGKRCFGLRTDLRNSGDFAGVPINLQVLHFIERSGGTLFRTIDAIKM